MTVTMQSIYNTALFGIRKRNYVGALKSDSTGYMWCSYRTDSGKREDGCAIGLNLPDELYDPGMDSGAKAGAITSILHDFPEVEEYFDGIDYTFLRQLQTAHDINLGKDRKKISEEKTIMQFEHDMLRLAERWSIIYTKA